MVDCLASPLDFTPLRGDLKFIPNFDGGLDLGFLLDIMGVRDFILCFISFSFSLMI